MSGRWESETEPMEVAPGKLPGAEDDLAGGEG